MSGDQVVPDSQVLSILFEEYKSRNQYNQQIMSSMLNITGLGLTAFAAMLAFLSANQIDARYYLVYWLLPMAFVLPYALVLNLFFTITLSSYYLRDLEGQIRQKASISMFNYELAAVRGLHSIRTGSSGVKASYLLMLLATGSLYLGVVLFCYDRLGPNGANTSPESIWAFLGLQGILAALMIWALYTALARVRRHYTRWIRHDGTTDPRHIDLLSFLAYFFLPRPFDFLIKGSVFWFSFLMAALALNWDVSAPLIVEALLVFCCLDFLSKQTTYIWNDTNDIGSDAEHSTKKGRYLARLGSRTYGKAMFWTRLAMTIGASFALASALDLTWVPAIVGWIFAWQFLYDRWAKSRGGRRLPVCSLGYAQRAIPGVLVVMHDANKYDPGLLVLITGWVVLLAFVFLAAYWYAEAKHEPKFRDREWFLVGAQPLQACANILLFPFGALIGLRYPSGPSLPLADAVGTISLLALGVLLLQWAAVKRETRPAWLVLALAAVLGGWLVGPPAYRLLVVALGVPLIVGVMYWKLEFEETMMPGLADMAWTARDRVDRFLFPEKPGGGSARASQGPTPEDAATEVV